MAASRFEVGGLRVLISLPDLSWRQLPPDDVLRVGHAAMRVGYGAMGITGESPRPLAPARALEAGYGAMRVGYGAMGITGESPLACPSLRRRGAARSEHLVRPREVIAVRAAVGRISTLRLVLRTVAATRYVTPLREGGSLPGLIEADDDGMYVLKFRGAGQGAKALVAELIVGELGRALGLPVPEIVLVQVDPRLGDPEPDPEIHDLIRASAGLNVGLDFLPGALAFSPAVGPNTSPELAAEIVWFDAFTTNPDRTPRNTNILVWHGRPWLIDHGAALYVHHTWRDPAAHARRAFERVKEHVLLPFAGSVSEADARLSPRISEQLLGGIVGGVPDALLEPDPRVGGPDEQRQAYVDYLMRRLEAPRPFVVEADDARAA